MAPEDPTLVKLDLLEREARALATRLVPTEDPNARYAGADSTGAVRVAIDGSARVHRVEVLPRWRELVAPEELGGAVVGAMAAAQRARVVAWFTALLEDTGVRPAAPVPPDVAVLGDMVVRLAGPGEQDSASVVRRVRSVLAMVRDELAGFATAHHKGYGNVQRVTATAKGTGALASVDYEPRWLAVAGAHEIAEETRLALDRAADLTGPQGLLRMVSDGPLAEVADLLRLSPATGGCAS